MVCSVQEALPMNRLVMRAFFVQIFFQGDSGGPRRTHLGCGRRVGPYCVYKEEEEEDYKMAHKSKSGRELARI